MTLLDRWREWAKADADARGLALGPLIDGLAASLARLRSIDWDEERQKLTKRSGEGGGA